MKIRSHKFTIGLISVLCLAQTPAMGQSLFGSTYGETEAEVETETPSVQQSAPTTVERSAPDTVIGDNLTGDTLTDEATVYEVLSGDTLSRIAGRIYGDSGLWPAIFNANYDLLGGDPGFIEIGMALDVPAFDDALLSEAPRKILRSSGRQGGSSTTDDVSAAEEGWLYSEGIARTVRREFLAFENPGRIDYLDPDLKEGDTVRQGQVLAYQNQRRPEAELDTAGAQITAARSQLAVTEAASAEAQASLRLAQRTFQRFEVLLSQNSASQQEHDEARASFETAQAAAQSAARQIDAARSDIQVAEATRSVAEVVREESYLTAPIDGIVARINYEEGDYFTTALLQTQTEQQVFDTVPIVLIDPSRYEISLNVPSGQLGALRVGTLVLIDIIDADTPLEERQPDLDASPPRAPEDYRIAGSIYSISPVVDAELRNFLVKIRTDRGHQDLRYGVTVSTWLKKIR